MGSAAEFKAMCKFLTDKKVPLGGLVDNVFKGLESVEDAFEKMKNGTQLGTFVSPFFLLNSLLISRKIGNCCCKG